MITKDNIQDYIDAYLRHELTTEEERDFLDAAEQNPEWKAQLQAEEQLVSSIAAMGQLNIRDRIKDDIASGKAYQASSKKYYYLIGLGVFAGIGAIVYNTVEGTENPQVTKQNVEHVVSHNSQKEEAISTENTSGSAPSLNKKTTSADEITVGVDQEGKVGEETNMVDTTLVKESSANKKETANGTVQENKNTSAGAGREEACEGITITFNLNALPSCEGESTGSIALSTIRGGKAPFEYRTTNEDLKNTGMSSIPAGVYAVEVTDSKGCSGTKYVMVEEKECKEKLQLLFRTDIQERVIIPVKPLGGSLKLRDQNENIVFDASLPKGESEFPFDGYTSKGKLKQGVYLIEIQYIDGQTTQGYLTIY